MSEPNLNNSTGQLAWLLAGFLLVILALESGGLMLWAQRLDVGPLSRVAVPATQWLHARLHALDLENLRVAVLTDLRVVGWADDPSAAMAVPTATPHLAEPAPVACTAPVAFAAPGLKPVVSSFKPAPLTFGDQLPEPPHTSILPPLPPVSVGRPRVVALAGDSMMAVGLSAVLLRKTAGDPALHIIKAFRSGTGLARPEVFNWLNAYPAMLAGQHPDVVIVAIGANDAQGFVDNDKVLAFGTPSWIQAYSLRVASFLDMVSANGEQVVWVGMPPMKQTIFNARMAVINRITYSVVKDYPRAIWWNPVGYIGDANGGFREFGQLPDGSSVRLRAADGIHLSDEGAGLLTGTLMEWLEPRTTVISTAH
jgi:lysophospholipase L1-like esterase